MRLGKRIFSLLLAAALVAVCAPLSSAKTAELRFNDDGKFKIVNFCDCQDGFPAHEEMLVYMGEVLDKYQPDLVVFGGDNTVGEAETKEQAIAELLQPVISRGINFTLVFGNHDHEQGVSDDELLTIYQRLGGELCLAYDDVPALSGEGTHNLPIASSDGSKTAFNLWLFDSNDYCYDENGKKLGWDSVHADQVEWYKQKAAQLKAENNGKVVPSIVFQHIIVQEIYDAMSTRLPFSLGAITRNYDGKSYSFLPIIRNMKGTTFEPPCPGYYNYGQFDAFLEAGDVLACFSGHDHLNSFCVNYKGINIENTPTCSFKTYSRPVNQGCKVITLDESDLSTYDCELVRVCDMASLSGSKLMGMGEIDAGWCSRARFAYKLLDYIVPIVSAIAGIL